MASHKHMFLMEWFIKIVPLQIAHSSASVDAEGIILGIFLNWNILIFSVFDANFVNIVVEFVEWMVQSKSLILQGLINVYFTLRVPPWKRSTKKWWKNSLVFILWFGYWWIGKDRIDIWTLRRFTSYLSLIPCIKRVPDSHILQFSRIYVTNDVCSLTKAWVINKKQRIFP